MKKTNRVVWDIMFPKQSKIIAERQYEGLQHGGIEWNKADNKAYLIYFRNHNAREQDRVDVDTLQTGRSSNDQFKKSAITVIQLLAALIAASSARYVEALGEIGFQNTAWPIFLAACVGMFFLAVAVWFTMDNHFVRVDKAWTNSLRSILTLNMPAILGTEKQTGFEDGAVSRCMLSFRQIIKWRRYLTFLHFVLVIFWVVEVTGYLYIVSIGTKIDLVEIALVVAIVLFQVLVFSRVSYLSWYHTNWRDPTVQLCLALAELDRQLVVAKRPGGPGAAGRGAHAVG